MALTVPKARFCNVGDEDRQGQAEWLSGIAGLPTPHIPRILTAAGTTVAYARLSRDSAAT